MSDKNISVKIKAKDYASGKLDEVKKKVEKVSETKAKVKVDADISGAEEGIAKLTNLISGFGAYKVGQLIGSVARHIVDLGVSAVKSAAQMKQYEIAFSTMLGSAERGKAMLEDLQAFAQATPFDLSGVVTAGQQLLAFGFEAESIIPTLRTLGDAAAGLGSGSEGVRLMGRALGEIKASGTLKPRDVDQLVRAGINVWQALADASGKSIAEIRDMTEKGMIDSTKAIEAITADMNERYAGMMESTSQEVLGLWNNVTESIGDSATTIGDYITEALNVKGVLKDVSDAVSETGQAFTQARNEGLSFSEAIKKLVPAPVIAGVGALAAVIAGSLVAALLTAVAVVGALIGLTAPVVAGLAAIGFVVTSLIVYWDEFKEGVVDALRIAAAAVLSLIPAALATVAGVIEAFANMALDSIGWLFESAIGYCPEWVESIRQAFNETLNIIIDWAGSALSYIAQVLAKKDEATGWMSSGNSDDWDLGTGKYDIMGNPIKPKRTLIDLTGVTGKSPRGTGAASRAAQKIQNEYKKALDKIKEMAADIAEKIANITETKEQAAIRALTKERVKYFNDIRKYQAAINAAQTEAEKAENAKKIADLTAQWKVHEAARRKEIGIESEKTGYELEMQHIQNLLDMNRISAAERINLQNGVLQYRRTQLEQLLNDETLNAEKRAEVEKQLAEVIKQAHQNAAYDMKTGWQQGLQEIANQQTNFKDATVNIFQSVEDGLVNFLSSTESFSRRLKSLFNDLANSIIKEISRVVAKMVIANAVSGLGRLFGGGFKPIIGNSNGPMPGMNSWLYNTPHYAAGGNFSPGFALVGEQGPEIVHFGSSGRVYNNRETKAMLGSGKPRINIHVHNESGQQMTAEAETKLDGEEYVTNIWLRAYLSNKNGLQDAIKGGMA